MYERTAAGFDVPAATCSTRSRSWASSARSASWTSIRCRPAACSRAVYVRDESRGGPVGRDLLGEASQVVGRGDREDVRAHPGRQLQLGELLGPVPRRPLEEAVCTAEAAVDVQHPPDVLRAPAGVRRRAVDPRVQLRELLELDVAERRDPAVGLLAGQPQHARLVGAQPDLDRVRGRRPRLRADDLVVAPPVPDRAGVGVPDRADDVDRLRERVDRLPGRQLRAAVGGDRLPERARPEPELDPPAAEDVQARGAAGEHDRRPQREVGDVRRDAHVGRLGRDHRQQRPHIQERGLIRVVLEADDIEAGDVGKPRQLDHGIRLAGDGCDEHAELEVVAIVGHGPLTV